MLNKYVDLDRSCLSDSEKKQVIDIFYKDKDTFGLRDEIGTYPNIEEETDVTDKSPFSIILYHIKEEDKSILDRKMRRLCCLGRLKEGVFSRFESGDVNY